ncbi:MAG: hypothetical protein ACHQUC_06235 [Chlamydiales bacterium]
MYNFVRLLAGSFMMVGIAWCAALSADNQTPTVSKIHSDHSLPFRVKLKKADFNLPMGVQTYVHGMYDNKVLIITGRIDGLHGFVIGNTNNFSPKLQNTSVFVLDLAKKKTYIRSLLDPKSGLTQNQVDLLSVTAAQAYQSGKTLYIVGGYGVDSATGQLNTKNALTAIDVPGLIHWVTKPCNGGTAAKHVRQIFDDTFKVTGGYMNKIEGDHPTLLVMGHEFNGFYNDPTQQPPVFQQYTEQVRRFHIIDDGVNLSIIHENPLPSIPDPNYRRRDLNVVPIVKRENHKLEQSFAVLSGVFTPMFGIWTVPVEVTADGVPSMADPNLPATFKQGMNSYDCATFGMFSEKTGEMYTILLGVISFGFFEETSDGFQFQTDPEIPFISQTTTLKIDKHGKYTQYFMKHGSFPLILSKTVNRGNPLLFGSECEAILLNKIPKYSNEVLKLDCITKPTVIGYVVGGIQSTLPNTNTQADTSTSNYIFKIIVEPVYHHCNASD